MTYDGSFERDGSYEFHSFSGSIDLIGGTWQAARGQQSVDLSGETAGAIYQDLPTVPGRRYRLRFALAGNPAGAPADKQLAFLDRQLAPVLAEDGVRSA